MMDVDQENDNLFQNRASQQRKVSYRNLLNRIEDIQESEDSNNLHTANELGHILQSANQINNECDISDRVANADETLLDANVLSAAGSLLVKCLENVDVSTSTYDASDFSTNLRESIQDSESEDIEPENLLKLMDSAREIVVEMPSYNFLYGTYDFMKLPEPKEKKQRKKEVQEKVETKQLTQVTNLEKDEEGILNIMNFFLKILLEEYRNNHNKPLSYYDFVNDSRSYRTTIENTFYCSFLLRDAKVKLDVDENNVITIAPTNKKDLKHFRSMEGINTQTITSITMDEWQKLKVKDGIIQRHKKE